MVLGSRLLPLQNSPGKSSDPVGLTDYPLAFAGGTNNLDLDRKSWDGFQVDCISVRISSKRMNSSPNSAQCQILKYPEVEFICYLVATVATLPLFPWMLLFRLLILLPLNDDPKGSHG